MMKTMYAAAVALCLLSLGLYGQLWAASDMTSCEKCHTDEATLKALFKPAKPAAAEEGEG